MGESVFKTRYPRLVSLSSSELTKAVHLGPGCYRPETNGMSPKNPSRCSPFNCSPERPELFRHEDPDLRYSESSDDESGQKLDDVEGESFRGDVAFADLAKDVQNFAPEVGRRKTSNKPKRRRKTVEVDTAKLERRHKRQLEKTIKADWAKYRENLDRQANDDFREEVEFRGKKMASPIVISSTENVRDAGPGSMGHSRSAPSLKGFSSSSGRFTANIGRVLESGDSPCVAYQLDMKSWTEVGSPISMKVRNTDEWNLLKCEGADAIYNVEDYWGKVGLSKSVALSDPENSTHLFGSDHGRFPECLINKEPSSSQVVSDKNISKRRQRLMKRTAFNTVEGDTCIDVLGNQQVRRRQPTGFGTLAPRFNKPVVPCTASVQLSPQFDIDKSGWESGISIPRGQYRTPEVGQTRVRPILVDQAQMNNHFQSQSLANGLASLKLTSSIGSKSDTKSSSHMTVLENDPFEWMYDRADGGEAATQCAGRLRQILMYNSNPEVVKQQEREKQEKILEKERNVVALHVPKSLNPILQKKADNLKATADLKRVRSTPQANQIRLTIKLMTGIGIEVKCSKGSTVGDVKTLIHRKRSYDPDSQVLIYEGLELEDDIALLKYGIKNHSTIRCIV